MNLTVAFIVLFIMFMAVVIGWSETWKKKEHYRCRVFELSKGKEGSTLVTVKPSEPSPTPPKKSDGIVGKDKTSNKNYESEMHQG